MPSSARLAAIALLLPTGALAQADPIAEFYKGRQVSIIVGSSAGGGYDAYARLVGRHIGNHIPGNPTVIVQNMPGAGQTRAAAHVYSVAVRDGTAIAAVSPGALLVPLLGGPKIQYDPSRFQHIGSANEDIYTCLVRPDAPVKTFAEAFEKELILGVSSGTTRDMPTALINLLKPKLKLVTGYPGTKEITLALQRGEVHGLCGFGYASALMQFPDQFAKGEVKVLLQEHARGHPDLNRQGVPLATSFAKTADVKQALELIYDQSIMGRPFIVGPEVPKERVAALSKALMAALKDPNLVAEAGRSRLELMPLSGEEQAKLIEKAYRTPAHVVEMARKALDIQD